MSEENENLEVKETPAAPEKEKKKREKRPKSKARKIIEWVLTGILAVLFVGFAAFQVDGMIHKKQNFNESVGFGYGTFVVKTDSMKDQYPVNSAIITHKDSAESIYKRWLALKAKGLDVVPEGKKETKSSGIDLTFKDLYTGPAVPSDSKYYYRTTTDGLPDERSYGMTITHRIREIQVNENVPLGEGRYIFILSGTNTEGKMSKAGQYQAVTEEYILGRVVVGSPFIGGIFMFVTSPWGLLVLLLLPAGYLVITSVLDIFKVMKDPDEEGAGGDDNDKPSSGGGGLDSLSKEDRERLKREMLDQMMKERGAKK